MKVRTRAASRSVPLYLALLALTVLAGLASRRLPDLLPAFVGRYAGDTLWAAMVFWFLALWWRRTATLRLAAGALAIAVAVEASQLYHAPWMDGLRETPMGGALLGRGFLWSDLACYLVGTGMAAFLDRTLARR